MTEEQTSPGTEFLIAEYQEIYREFTRQRQEGLNRLNFFITLTSVIGAALVLVSEFGSPSPTDLQHIALGALTFLIIIGWYTFDFAIGRDTSTDMNVRASARIRRYFADQHPAVKTCLTWQDHDEPSPWITENVSNIRRTAQTLLTLLCALFVGILLNLLTGSLPFTIGGSITALAVVLVALRFYALRKFKQAGETATRDVRFPRWLTDKSYFHGL